MYSKLAPYFSGDKFVFVKENQCEAPQNSVLIEITKCRKWHVRDVESSIIKLAQHQTVYNEGDLSIFNINLRSFTSVMACSWFKIQKTSCIDNSKDLKIIVCN